jgi:N-acetylglucosamine-6-phosphate deacetylase
MDINMKKLSFYNSNYFADDGLFHHGGFCVEEGRFAYTGTTNTGIDLKNAYVIPGLLDIHTHGNSGYDFSTCSAEELAIIARAHAKAGVAGFCPTSMTLPENMLARCFSHAAQLYKSPPAGGARILGINMEGPFLSPRYKGAQKDTYLLNPDKEVFNRLQQAAQGCIRLIDIAPELPGAMDFIKAIKSEVIVSLAHTDADYDKAAEGFVAGITHITHMFNAMNGLHHRAPGPIGAAAERQEVMVELIADGVHIHPSVIKLCFKLFGAGRICLVSDSMEACGMKDGIYKLGGQTVKVEGSRSILENGTIAGSVTCLYQCMLNIIAWGISKEDAVRAAALTPAERLDVHREYGSISNGKKANFVIADEGFNIKQIYIDGELVDA